MNYSITVLEDELNSLQAELETDIHLFGDMPYLKNRGKIADLKKSILILNEAIVERANLKNLCSECGKPLTLVRPGKYQCDNCVT